MREPTITRERVEDAIARSNTFPNVPRVAVPIIQMAYDEKASYHDLARIIETDHELASRILRIANSGFYSFPKRIRTIQHAIIMLGWNTIKMIALGSSLLMRMCKEDRRLFSHSMRVAQIARFLAMEADFYKVDEIAVVGLLHDIGDMILGMYFPEEHLRAREYADERGVPFHIAERAVLDLDHADVGGWTLEAWNLPENISESVAKHNSFDPLNYHARKTAVIHVADVLAFATDFRGPASEKVPPMSQTALKILGFSQDEFRDLVLYIMKMKLDPVII